MSVWDKILEAALGMPRFCMYCGAEVADAD